MSLRIDVATEDGPEGHPDGDDREGQVQVVLEGSGPGGVTAAVGHHHPEHAEHQQQQQSGLVVRLTAVARPRAQIHQAIGWSARGTRLAAGQAPGIRADGHRQPIRRLRQAMSPPLAATTATAAAPMRKGTAEPVDRCVADAGAESTILRPVEGRPEVPPGGRADGVVARRCWWSMHPCRRDRRWSRWRRTASSRCRSRHRGCAGLRWPRLPASRDSTPAETPTGRWGRPGRFGGLGRWLGRFRGGRRRRRRIEGVGCRYRRLGSPALSAEHPRFDTAGLGLEPLGPLLTVGPGGLSGLCVPKGPVGVGRRRAGAGVIGRVVVDLTDELQAVAGYPSRREAGILQGGHARWGEGPDRKHC